MKNNERGSTLLLMVITIALLSVLGTAVLSMNTMNVTMKYSDESYKNIHYDAEAGIEQAYTIVAQEVAKCLNQSKDDTIEKAQTLIQDIERVITDIGERYMDESGAINMIELRANMSSQDQAIFDSYILNNYNSATKLQINSNELEKQVIADFEARFIHNWNEILNPADTSVLTLKAKLKDEGNYKFEKPTVITIKGIAADGSLVNELQEMQAAISGSSAITETKISVTTQYKDNEMDQALSAEIRVTLPSLEGNFIEIIPTQKIENVMWQQALVSEQDIIVNGDAIINGTVYAYGTKSGDGTEVSNLTKFGGVIVPKDGDLKVTGDVISHSLIQVRENGKLFIDKGHIYCNSLIIQDNANGAKIDITNSIVYTEDDLEHNGTKSQLLIDGAYIGFSIGNKPMDSLDKSSSIVINTRDIQWNDEEEGSILKITGSNPLKASSPSIKQGGETNVSDIKIFVPGVVTVFNNANDRSQDYKTGESVSIKGNYLGYTYQVNGFANPSKTINGMDFFEGNVAEKATYIEAFYNQYKDDVNLPIPFLVGLKGLQIPLENYSYTLGARLGTATEALDSQKLTNEVIVGGVLANELNPILDGVEMDYRQILNTLTYRTDNNWEANYEIDRVKIVEKYINPENETPDNYELKEVELHPILNEIDGREGILQCTAGNVSLSGSSISTPKKYRGIIISGGNVTLSGNIDFEGVIIAKGNITIEKDARVNITNNSRVQAELTQMVNANETFKNIFKNNATYDSYIGITLDDILAANYNHLVQVNNWQQVIGGSLDGS